jgi:hypothetical protein
MSIVSDANILFPLSLPADYATYSESVTAKIVTMGRLSGQVEYGRYYTLQFRYSRLIFNMFSETHKTLISTYAKSRMTCNYNMETFLFVPTSGCSMHLTNSDAMRMVSMVVGGSMA